MITTDVEAWQKYPFHRSWFNKLWVADTFGYLCGPNAVSVPVEDNYIVKPIYNLHGMGAGAKIKHLRPEDVDHVPPGYFWCERFIGDHYSIELTWRKGHWNVVSVFQGFHSNGQELFRFVKWKRVSPEIHLPKKLDELWDCGSINVEMIDSKIIEVHLRGTPDPVEYDELIPIWSDTPECVVNELKTMYNKFIPSEDKVLNSHVSRLGFFVK